jgi:hypothetical protein
MKKVVTMVSKLVIFIGSKGINNYQFKDFASAMESEYGDAVRKFIGWVVIGFLIACTTWRLKPNYFWKWKGSFFLGFK